MTELKIEEATRKQVAEFLPPVIKRTFGSYHDFVQQEPDNTQSKLFKEHHAACKVAIAHIALLLSLASKVEVDVQTIAAEDPEMRKAIDEYAKFLSAEPVPED